MTEAQITREAEKFRNYWRAKAGKGAVKRDWQATWRNWILNALEWKNDRAISRRTLADAFASLEAGERLI